MQSYVCAKIGFKNNYTKRTAMMKVGIISGIISGLIVAIIIETLRQIRRPRLELKFLGEGRAALTNTTWYPTVIGGTWLFEHGPCLYRPDGHRGGESGFFLRPFGTMIVGTDHFRPGQVAEISYKRAALWPKGFTDAERREMEEWTCPPADYISNNKPLPKGWTISPLRFTS